MKAPARMAISYARFSDPKQAEVDSEDRQAIAFATFCERHALTPLKDQFTDRGLSGFHATHRTRGDMGRLERFAERGDFPTGTVLVIEAWDRLGRQRPDRAVKHISKLLECGLSIGICRLDDIFTEDDFGTHKWTTLAVFVQLAHQESKQKADRVRSAIAAHMRRVREQGESLTGSLPAWVDKRDGVLRLIPERAAAVRRIYQWAADGLGIRLILRKLDEEQVPAFGKSGRWTFAYVALLLRDRRVIGEHQPRHKHDGTPNGEPIRGCLPAAVEEPLYHAARAGMEQRTDRPGRPAKLDGKGVVNVFSGLLRDARTGKGYQIRCRREPVWDRRDKCRRRSPRGKQHHVLESAAAKESETPHRSFPFAVFEKAVLTCLREIPPTEIVGAETTPQEVAVIEGQLAEVRSRRLEVKADMVKRYSSTLAEVAQELEAREGELESQLAAAQLKLATPMSQAWQDAHTLMDVIDGADDPEGVRLRLRTALRRMVSGVYLLVVPKGSTRLCAVQIDFHGGGRRSYLIHHRPPRGNGRASVPGGWRVHSFADVAAPGDLDLRKPADAAALEKALTAIDLNALPE